MQKTPPKSLITSSSPPHSRLALGFTTCDDNRFAHTVDLSTAGRDLSHQPKSAASVTSTDFVSILGFATKEEAACNLSDFATLYANNYGDSGISAESLTTTTSHEHPVCNHRGDESGIHGDLSNATSSIGSALSVVEASDLSRRAAKYRGVRKRSWGKWVSEIRLPSSPMDKNKRSRIWLGSYWNPEAAARAYDTAAYHLRGDAASLNFPKDIPPPPHSLSPTSIQAAAVAEGARCDRELRNVLSFSPPPSSSAASSNNVTTNSPSKYPSAASSSCAATRLSSNYEPSAPKYAEASAAMYAGGRLTAASMPREDSGHDHGHGHIAAELSSAQMREANYAQASQAHHSSPKNELSSVHTMAKDEDEAAFWYLCFPDSA